MPGICMSRMARSKLSPARSHSRAWAALWVSRGIIPHLRVCRVRMRQLVGLSSTISRRRSASCGCGPSSASGGASGAACKGRVKWKVEPFCGTLSTHILPPINSTSRLLMARPRPVPPYWRVVEASAWLKDLNRRASRSTGMPMPVSRTRKWSCHGSDPVPGSFRRGKDLHLDHHFARGGELDPIAQQVDEHLPQPGHIAAHLRRNAVVHLVGDIQFLLRRFRRPAGQARPRCRRAGQTAGSPVRACRIRSSRSRECR